MTMTPLEADALGKVLREEFGALHGLLTMAPDRQAYIIAFVFDAKDGKGQVITQSNVASQRLRRTIAGELKHRIALIEGAQPKGK